MLAAALLAPVILVTPVAAQCVSLTALNSPDNQNFDTLANSGTANTALPAGWLLVETGGGARDNEQYAGDKGGATPATRTPTARPAAMNGLSAACRADR
jgi:hypothetical protein